MFFSKLALIEHPAAQDTFAIPNGAIGPSWRRRAYFAAEGCKKGVIDVLTPYASGGKIGLWQEFKYGNNEMTKEQIDWARRMTRNGYAVFLPYTWQQGLENFARYLGITLPPELLA